MPTYIYKITQIDDDTDIYVGSTKRTNFNKRVCDHRKPSNVERHKNLHLYSYILEQNGWANFRFDILEEHETMTKTEMKQREKEYVNLLLPICNMIRPIATAEEKRFNKCLSNRNWRSNNKDKMKQYYIMNTVKESYKEKVKNRCTTRVVCECGGYYTKQNKTNHYNKQKHKDYETSKNSQVTQS